VRRIEESGKGFTGILFFFHYVIVTSYISRMKTVKLIFQNVLLTISENMYYNDIIKYTITEKGRFRVICHFFSCQLKGR
jgi:hypothetical protein